MDIWTQNTEYNVCCLGSKKHSTHPFSPRLYHYIARSVQHPIPIMRSIWMRLERGYIGCQYQQNNCRIISVSSCCVHVWHMAAVSLLWLYPVRTINQSTFARYTPNLYCCTNAICLVAPIEYNVWTTCLPLWQGTNNNPHPKYLQKESCQWNVLWSILSAQCLPGSVALYIYYLDNMVEAWVVQ